MKKRLLLITPFFSPNVGGVETRLDDLVKTLRKYGHEVTVLTYQPLTSKHKGKPYETASGLKIIRLTWPGGDLFHKLLKLPALEVLYLVPGLLVLSLGYIALHQTRFDTIHTPGLNSAIVGRLLKVIYNIRWVVSTHSLYGFRETGLFSNICRQVLSGADHIVALSDPSKKELLRLGLKPERLSTEYTWVDQERFRPMDRTRCRQQLEWAPASLSVLFVGRLLPEKGADILLQTAALLPEVHFKIVGTGPQEHIIQEAANKLQNVSFQGHVNQEGLPLYYNAADIFVLPSRYPEGLGRVLLEALSCGTPVIVNPQAAIAKLIEAAAIIVSTTAEDLAMQLQRIVRDPTLLEEKRRQARPLAEKWFGESNINGLLKAYGWH